MFSQRSSICSACWERSITCIEIWQKSFLLCRFSSLAQRLKKKSRQKWWESSRKIWVWWLNTATRTFWDVWKTEHSLRSSRRRIRRSIAWRTNYELSRIFQIIRRRIEFWFFSIFAVKSLDFSFVKRKTWCFCVNILNESDDMMSRSKCSLKFSKFWCIRSKSILSLFMTIAAWRSSSRRWLMQIRPEYSNWRWKKLSSWNDWRKSFSTKMNKSA